VPVFEWLLKQDGSLKSRGHSKTRQIVQFLNNAHFLKPDLCIYQLQTLQLLFDPQALGFPAFDSCAEIHKALLSRFSTNKSYLLKRYQWQTKIAEF
jgi:hypothetical protein